MTDKNQIFEAKRLLKLNVIKLAKYHKERCNEEFCDISLCITADSMIKLGIKMTPKEIREMM